VKERLRLGVSSCLLGQPVRFDGGHKRNRFLTDQLSPFADFVPVCPEVEAGLGTPRPTLRLVRGDGGDTRLVEGRSGHDRTDQMRRFAERRVERLRKLELSGYVLKKDSPSCGVQRVKVYTEQGMPERVGRGVFTEELVKALPNLPVEDEGRLQDPALRENFIERAFAYRDLRRLFGGDWTIAQVVAFHTAHKLQLLAHSPSAYRSLGRLVAKARRSSREDFALRYESEFMTAMAKVVSRGRNANVLHHSAGYLRRGLDRLARAELADLIRDYREGLIPLIVPITMIGHHARRQEADYLLGQAFLSPHPRALMLRNQI